ncbi:MAG TPA: ATP-grasp domain-containing protein [Actinopolymorphaceae bacterium]
MTEEIVVVVRDAGLGWVTMVADAVRAQQCRVGLVTAPLADHEAAELAVDHLVEVDDPTDPELVAEAATKLSAHGRIAAVLSSSDGTVVSAARAAELLGVGRTPAAPIERSRNKLACRSVLAAAGLPGPRYALLSSPAETAQVAASVGLPAVVKPVNGTGSHLVERVHSVDELAGAYERFTAAMRTTRLRHVYSRDLDGLDPKRTFLVESMLKGREYAVDLVVRDGVIEHIALVDKVLVDDRFFERGFVSPPLALDPGLERRLRSAVDDAVRALGIDNTVAHVEVIDDESSGPTIVEVNAGRPAGQLLGILFDLNTGINTTAELVAVTRGAPSPRVPPRLPMPLASLTVYAEETGTLRAIHGLDEVAELPDVVAAIPMAHPGDVITDEYEAFAVNIIVAGFIDTEDLMDTYETAVDLLRLEIEP